MRTNTLLLSLVTALLVVAAAGTALAQGGREHARDDARADNGKERADAASNGTDGNQSARAEAAKARHAEMKGAREAALASFKENRTAALDAYHAANNATRASFLENKTRVIEACQAAKNTTNESHCVRDGLKPLIAKARAEHRENHDALKERLVELRESHLKGFRAAKADAERRHGRDG